MAIACRAPIISLLPSISRQSSGPVETRRDAIPNQHPFTDYENSIHFTYEYTKRTNPTREQLNVTLPVDRRVNAIFDFHVTTTKHDSQIAPSLT